MIRGFVGSIRVIIQPSGCGAFGIVSKSGITDFDYKAGIIIEGVLVICSWIGVYNDLVDWGIWCCKVDSKGAFLSWAIVGISIGIEIERVGSVTSVLSPDSIDSS